MLALPTLLALAGCAHQPPSAPSTKTGPVSELHLLSTPVAVNLDARPGVDGFGIKIYALGKGNPKPTAIGQGTMEILMYDGTLTTPRSDETPPLHSWSFTSDLLNAHQFRTAIGIGYAFTLAWGVDQPKQNRITVVARYVPKDGPPVYSSPSILSVSFTAGPAKAAREP